MRTDLQTISQISKQLNVTPRMLRYYEKLGLIKSLRVEDYAYRMYDAENTVRIQQILFLRKLRLSLKDIGVIIDNEQTQAALQIFEANIQKIDQDIEAYTMIRLAFERLMTAFQASILEMPFLTDDFLQEVIDQLPQPATTLKEEITMTKLDNAEKTLEQIEPRIVYLPPSDVAAAHYIGADPEQNASQLLWTFINEHKLWEQKPDLRLYGFNHPNPTEENPVYGYEYWVTIPADLEVPAPLTKKHFAGGQYAAHGIAFGNFQEWGVFDQWLRNSEEYEYRGNGSPENMFDSMEEHLDAYTHLKTNDPNFPYLDLLMPVRKK